MRPTSVCLAVALLACTGASAQQVSPHARNAVEAIRQLRAIGLPDPNALDLGPPAKVPGLLRQLNQELKAIIADDLNDGTIHALPDEKEILDQLRAAGWDEIPSHKWNAYGEIRQINFDWKTDYDPGLVVVTTQLWIPCSGDDPDSSIYVFQGAGRHWHMVLSTDSDFSLVGDINGTGMQYGVSPPDSDGHWFLVVAHSPPSCRDHDAILRYKVLKPGASPDQPTVLLTRREQIDAEFDPAFAVEVQSDWFAVTEGKVRRLDGETGVSIFRYRVTNDQAQRIAPLALTPEDFLDQWVQLSWDDARQWSKDSLSKPLQAWHAKLSGLASDSTEFESVHRCADTGDGDVTWLIDLFVDQQLNPSMKQEKLYIEVAKSGGVFSVQSIHDIHPSECQGRTPVTPVADRKLPSW
jgi:hypothetical protein